MPPELLLLAQICTKSFVGWGLRHRPHWGSLERSPRPASWIKGPTSKGRGEKGKEGEGMGRDGRGDEGRGEGRGEGEGGEEEGEEKELPRAPRMLRPALSLPRKVCYNWCNKSQALRSVFYMSFENYVGVSPVHTERAVACRVAMR